MIIKNSTVAVDKHTRTVMINDSVYHMPKKMAGNSVKIINTTLYIDGYKMVDGEWKVTVKALWHKYF